MDMETLTGKARLAFNDEMAKVSGIYNHAHGTTLLHGTKCKFNVWDSVCSCYRQVVWSIIHVETCMRLCGTKFRSVF